MSNLTVSNKVKFGNLYSNFFFFASLVAQTVKNLPAMQETQA